MMIHIFALLLALLASPVYAQEAHKQEPPKKTEAPKVEAPKVEQKVEAPKPNPDDFCKGRGGCKFLWSDDAGTIDKKHFIISEVAIPHEAKEVWQKCRRPQDKRFGQFLDNVSQEIWLSTYGGLLPEHKKLFELCNDGYGAANIGEDSFTFGNGHVTYRQSGGSNDRWVWARSYALPSLAHSGTMLCDYRTNASGGHIRLIDYETGVISSGYSPQMDEQTSSFENCQIDSLNSAKPKYKSIDTKQIASYLGIKLDDIKALGTCASTITSRPGPYQGYVIYGQDDGSADVEVRYLRINDDKLWVDIRDNGRVFKATDNWVNDDRVEIWWLDQRQMPSKTSVDLEDAPRKALRQFAVRLSDMKVFAGYGYSGNQKLPEVERRDGGLPLGFKITWPAEQFPSSAGLTVSYAHADNGGTKVVWSSSIFRYADPQSLSPIYNLQGDGHDPTQSCTITKDGVINLVQPPALDKKP